MNDARIAADPGFRDDDARRVLRFTAWFFAICLALLALRLAFSASAVGVALGRFWDLPAGKVALIGGVLALAARTLWPRARFLVHAAYTALALATLNYMISHNVPLTIREIESSYLIFFYHFPAALNCFVYFAIVLVCGVLYLRTRSPVWDTCARVAGKVGLLACTIVLTTGSTWASAAWNQWWIWDDPRLMTAAILWLTYVGYVVLATQLEDVEKRRRYCAVYGILAFLNVPAVHYAIEWFNKSQVVSHPMKFDDMSSDPNIILTRWFGVVAFACFYALLYRWELAREGLRERVEDALAEVRRIEEES
ncbi:MAG: cytochrome c biogenesis protein CcsA [Planctomycetota bacterium]